MTKGARPREGGGLPPRKNVIPAQAVISAQAGIQKVDSLQTAWPIPTSERPFLHFFPLQFLHKSARNRVPKSSSVLWDTHPNPWNKAARIVGAIGQKCRILNVRVQTHVRLLGSPVSGRSLAGEAMPRPPASNRGCPNPVSQVMNQHIQLPAAQND